MSKTLKRMVSLLLVLSLLAAGLTAVAAPETELSENDMIIEALYGTGVITGYPDGTYKPEQALTRAQAAALIARVLPDSAQAANAVPIDAVGHWGEEYISLCVEKGLLLPDENGNFMPDVKTTYSEFTGALIAASDGYGAAVPPEGNAGDEITRGGAAKILYSFITYPLNDSGLTRYSALKTDYALEHGELLRYFTLAAYYEDNMINAVPLTENPEAFIWNSEYGAYVSTNASIENIRYNFVAVYDVSGDGLGDTILIVKRPGSESIWNADAVYTDPRAGKYADSFNNEYNIPYGERLLGFADVYGFLDGAAVDYYNTAVYGDLASDIYYPSYDWFNSTSTDSLTILSGFRTAQQTTGWACGVTSALMVMDWFKLRHGLNELDLAALRNTKEKYGEYRWGGATDVKMFINVFNSLNEMENRKVWDWVSTYDFIGGDGELSEDYLSPEWIREMLDQGKPVLVGWNSFGGHWQVIIGYDDMGTETTADDVLILADPYDSTDHRNDGVNVQSYERLYYDWTQNFDRDFALDEGWGMPVVFAPYPAEYESSEFVPKKGAGLAAKNRDMWNNAVNYSDDMYIPYDDTVQDLLESEYSYAKSEAGENGMAGPANSSYLRTFEYQNSPYYAQLDFYGKGSSISDTLTLFEGFKTSQQASEWTCGPSSARMVLEWYGMTGGETEFSLAQLRERDIEGATTLDGMVEIFEKLGGFGYYTVDDLDEDFALAGYGLFDGKSDDGLIPFCVDAGIPILIGWDEWGGHWQVIIGYDDMGTPETQDDVLILADPYDTTDHLQDGYVIESFERLVYGWGSAFDERGEYAFLIAFPDEIDLFGN